MSKTEKKFDAVAMMRSARDKLSATIERMTLEEELKWLSSQEVTDPFFFQCHTFDLCRELVSG